MKKFSDITESKHNEQVIKAVGVSAEHVLSVLNVLANGTTTPVFLEESSMGKYKSQAVNNLISLKSAAYIDVDVIMPGRYIVSLTNTGIYH